MNQAEMKELVAALDFYASPMRALRGDADKVLYVIDTPNGKREGITLQAALSAAADILRSENLNGLKYDHLSAGVRHYCGVEVFDHIMRLPKP